jgi:DNA-binding response OmpR family regulator
MASRILIVEDDPDTTEIIEAYLQIEGYSISSATDGLAALRKFREETPDLIILDLMIPKVDGLAVCRNIREESWVPIIILTARVEERDRLIGLELGADDYVSKPFSPQELVARVKAVLRRSERDAIEQESSQINYREIDLDINLHEVTVGGVGIPVTPTEMRLLSMFVKEPKRVFTRAQIIERAFGSEYERFDRTVDSHISNLRQKLKAAGADYVQTIYGVGYRFSDED